MQHVENSLGTLQLLHLQFCTATERHHSALPKIAKEPLQRLVSKFRYRGGEHLTYTIYYAIVMYSNFSVFLNLNTTERLVSFENK